MKKYLASLAVVLLLSSFTGFAFAQEDTIKEAIVVPRWVSEKGYWVVENNINQPKTALVRFYNNENTLVYKEQITGIVLKLNKRRVKMKLKKVLEASVLAWTQHEPAKDEQRLTVLLKK